jgi:hypothetical protein
MCAAQLRAVPLSMHSLIATARERQHAPRTLCFELQTLAATAATLADSAVGEASGDEASG